MVTPKEYEKNIKKGIITEKMLAECIYSVNKRAKNYRDKIREIWRKRAYNPYWYDKYGNEEKYAKLEMEYYDSKDKMLSLIKPKCIHKNSYEEYFLYYILGEYSFHSPIRSYSEEKYKDLEVTDIGELTTFGRVINDLISVQFVKKVLCLIDSGDYTFINNNKDYEFER